MFEFVPPTMSDNDNNNISQSAESELIEFCISESLSEDGIREIIERHGFSPKQNHDVGDYDFFRVACLNKRVNEGIIRCLLEYFPDAASAASDEGWSLLHYACDNENVTLNIVQLLIDAAPESVRSVNRNGRMPLHLCMNQEMDEKTALEILRLLVEKCPEAAQHADNFRYLPLHLACCNKYVTLNIVQLLIDAAPDSVRSVDEEGWMPLHHLCRNKELDETTAIEILRLLIEKCPEAVHHVTNIGSLPLHLACCNTHVTLKIVQLLIDAAPNSVRSGDEDGYMALHNLCRNEELDESAALEILKLFIEKHPETIRHANNNGGFPIHCAAYGGRKPEFCRILIEAYPGSERMTSANGMLPFHCACLKNTVATVEYLYKLYPDAINLATATGGYPIHLAIFSSRCEGNNKTDIVKFLLDCDPSVVSQKDREGRVPLQHLCMNTELDERAALDILRLLIEKCPDSIRHANHVGSLPIHCAVNGGKTTEFCRALIEAYPGSERMTDEDGVLPIHYACLNNTLATVEYLYKRHPDAIDHATAGGYPIHAAIVSVDERDDPITAIDIVEFLLDCDPNVTLQKGEGKTLLRFACHLSYNDSKIEAALEIIEAIYDAHPEAIEDDDMVSDIHEFHEQVQAFINSQLVYARQAKDRHVMTTPDGNGRLPLHTALQNNVRLGSIKLLVKGNPPAVQSPNNSGLIPLHVACVHHNSASVVQFLIGLDATTLDAVDGELHTALHFACRSARHETISMLLDKYGAVSVSQRNAHGKLPIDLLWESNDVLDRESSEYTESVFRLLKAYPEMVMVMNIDMQQQQSAAPSCPSHNGKKRKFGNEE